MFHNPLGWLAFLGVGAVVLLHVFRRRFRAHTVGALFLWERRDESVRTGRTPERVHTSPSFWAEVAAAALLALVIASPRGCGGSARHLVIVLDSSASMGAVDPATGRSAADRAVERVRASLDALSARGRVSLVHTGRPPALLAGPAARGADANQALATWRPGSVRHDLEPALVLARQLAGEDRVWLLTDRLGVEADHTRVTAVGRELPNVAITRATRSREHEAGVTRDRVFVSMQSFHDTARTVRGQWQVEGGVANAFELELAPGEVEHLRFDLPDGSPGVDVRLEDDALGLDNHVHLLPAPIRRLRLASTLAPGLEQRLGLNRDGEGEGALERWRALVPDSALAATPEEAELVLASGEPVPGTWSLVLVPPGEARVDARGPFLIEKEHPLLFGTTFEGLVWSYAEDFRAPGIGLAWAGSVPLLADELRSRDERVLRFNVDTGRTTLWRSPDWPILLANVAEERRRELPGPRASNVRVGEPFVLARPERGRYERSGPDGTVEVPFADPLVLEGLERPGVYELRRDGTTVERLAVHFADPGESDLRGLGSSDEGSEGAESLVRAELSPLQLVLLLGVLGLLLFDWWWLARGRRGEQAA